MDTDVLKLLGSGGVVGALLFLIYLVGNRLVAALDRVAGKVDEHTKADVAAHGEVRAAVERLEGKMDAALDWQGRTPVHGTPRARTGGG